VAWSPDGQLIASFGYDDGIRVWDADTGQEAAHSTGGGELAWSPDGSLLAAGGEQMRVWAVVEGSGESEVETAATPTTYPGATLEPTLSPSLAENPTPAEEEVSDVPPLPAPDAGWHVGTVLGDIFVNELHDIAIDPYGRLWFATSIGINMRAGESWMGFLDTNSDLLDNNVTSVAFDSAGRPWIGSDGGVNVIEGTQWRSYTTQNSGLPPVVYDEAITAPVVSIVIDSADVVWISTVDGGLTRFDGGEWTHFGFDGEEWGPYSEASLACSYEALAVDGQDRLWVGAPGGGVFMYDGAAWHTLREDEPTIWALEECDGDVCETIELCNISDRSINSIVIDAAGRVWTGSWQGVNRYDGQVWTSQDAGFAGDQPGVETLALAPDGRLWAVTLTGEFYALGGDGTWIDYTELRPIANHKMMNDLVIDSQGRLWFGDYVLEPPE
ncbi:MAG: hypothetical protein ACK2U5_09420, partial [Candidatus Promineifilaceae bacterium]